MKRSERLNQLKAFTLKICPDLIEHSAETLAERYLVEEEEALRLTWDPEEEPLPERLILEERYREASQQGPGVVATDDLAQDISVAKAATPSTTSGQSCG